jgi:flagellin-like hook-associated protein FlgL
VQAASDTIGESERGFTDREFQELKDEIDKHKKNFKEFIES